MADSLLRRIPVVGSLAYRERIHRLPSAFVVTLVPEPDNRYLPCAIAVLTDQQKVGYVAPEVARRYYEPLRARAADGPVSCAGRRASRSDHETSGVELLLDFSDFTGLPVAPEE
jgi:hypothetical protein